MYSIEYYKRGKNEPDWVRERKHKDDFKDPQDYKDYLKDIKIFNACRNIKSLTIDFEDLDLLHTTHNPYCEYSCDSYDLGVICDCARSLSAERVVIENDGYGINRELIYNIINTKWLINKDSFEYADDYDDEAIKKIMAETHQILSRIDAGSYQTWCDCVLDDCVKQLRHYCYESEKINRGEVEEVQKKPKKIGMKQLHYFFDHYDY